VSGHEVVLTALLVVPCNGSHGDVGVVPLSGSHGVLVWCRVVVLTMLLGVGPCNGSHSVVGVVPCSGSHGIVWCGAMKWFSRCWCGAV
jgi:hypothetical protein